MPGIRVVMETIDHRGVDGGGEVAEGAPVAPGEAGGVEGLRVLGAEADGVGALG